MTIRRLLLVSHRWLGLTVSAILAIVGATGALLMWRLPYPRLGRAASRLHEQLALGLVGDQTVEVACAVALFLQAGGVVLWWKRKTLWVRRGSSWWRLCFDLHQMVGIIGLPLMFLMAATALVMAWLSPVEHPEVWRLARRLHTGHYGFAVELLYAVASFCYAVQGLTGVIVWWKAKATL